jgi:hypothetical protein
MNGPLRPYRLAWFELLGCLAICGLVVLLSRGTAMTDPVRLGVMVFVIVTVPTVNFIIRTRRRREN